MRRASALANAFEGRWRITEMDVWDNDYLDLVEPAHAEQDQELPPTGAAAPWKPSSGAFCC